MDKFIARRESFARSGTPSMEEAALNELLITLKGVAYWYGFSDERPKYIGEQCELVKRNNAIEIRQLRGGSMTAHKASVITAAVVRNIGDVYYETHRMMDDKGHRYVEVKRV